MFPVPFLEGAMNVMEMSLGGWIISIVLALCGESHLREDISAGGNGVLQVSPC